ncbi:MAG: hypothetical protein AB8F95_14585 [Bacteroidia bacterium]
MIRLIFTCLIASFLFTACQPEAPAEAEIRAKIVGDYCNDTYSLYITDKTYRCVKYSPAILGTMPITESCESAYSLEQTDGKWVLRFERDPDPKGIQHCEFSFTVWDADKGFLLGEDRVKIKEPFDKTDLLKGGCEP